MKSALKYEYIHIAEFAPSFSEIVILTNLEKKQRSAVNVVRTALDSQGIHGRDVCASWASRVLSAECAENFAVFVSAPPGADIEPYYETGKTLTEAVRKVLAAVKGQRKKNGVEATDESPEAAPF
ncbi:hypothetical protein [Candidatus Methylomicrobium oryzae]|jgi:hypothetical protein|uniref:hypothetical protein n=1 Tax=Candidatus Methylomicrobium oryzae TaxID=2802053 RepID=UPI001F1DE2CA|nr:hypothetical protein [Methylomicrobium sp. RS1]